MVSSLNCNFIIFIKALSDFSREVGDLINLHLILCYFCFVWCVLSKCGNQTQTRQRVLVDCKYHWTLWKGERNVHWRCSKTSDGRIDWWIDFFSSCKKIKFLSCFIIIVIIIIITTTYINIQYYDSYNIIIQLQKDCIAFKQDQVT